MRTVEESRFVRAPPAVVRRALSPAAVVEYEGTLSVRDVEVSDEGWLVTAHAAGRLLEIQYAFEEREDGYVYRAGGEVGPFSTMETTLSIAPEDEGSRVTLRSTVGLRLPLPFADRIAAWKRRGELRRGLDRLAADVE